MKHTTIKDVAKAAGVSITTVSQVLSNKGSLKEETRSLVTKIAGEMNYVPDWHGSSLKKRQNKCIALFVGSISGYYYELAEAVKKESTDHGYELEILFSDDSKQLTRKLLSNRLDCAIVLNDAFSDKEAEKAEQAGVPMVYMDRLRVGKYTSSVVLNSRETGRIAAEYLYGLGHRRLMVIEGKNTYNATERFLGFQEYLSERGISLDDGYRLKGHFLRTQSYDATKAFLGEKRPLPDAIFALNDDSAFGCMKAFMEAGYSFPWDISMIGCDDIELSQWFIPPLTTINPNARAQGTEAAKQLVSLISGAAGKPTLKISGTLVVRSSCRPNKAAGG